MIIEFGSNICIKWDWEKRKQLFTNGQHTEIEIALTHSNWSKKIAKHDEIKLDQNVTKKT